MDSLRKGFHLRQLLCIVLVIGMVLIGFPVGILAEEAPPVKVKFVPGGAVGGPRGFEPHTEVPIRAVAYNAEGIEVKCDMKYIVVPSIAGEVIAGDVYEVGGKHFIKIGSARGSARVEAFCKGYERVKAYKLVTGSGGVAPFTPTEITPTEITPTEITPTEITPTEITPTEITPTEIQSGVPTPKKSGPGVGTALLIGGGVVAGGVLIGIAAGLIGKECQDGYAPCNASWGKACCPDLWKYGSDGKCYRTVFDVPSGVSSVTCHW